MVNVKRVKEGDIGVCVHCGHTFGENDGATSKKNNLVKFDCPYCSGIMYYIVDENVAKALGTCRAIIDEGERVEYLGGNESDCLLLAFDIGAYIEIWEGKYLVTICNSQYYFENIEDAILRLIEDWVVIEVL